MANYIHTLQDENAELRGKLAETHDVICELCRYLSSDKFTSDPYVNVGDVFARLADAKLATSGHDMKAAG